MAKKLTKKDIADLQAYQAAIREWERREPEKLSDADWETIMPFLSAGADVPPAYTDRIGIGEILDGPTQEDDSAVEHTIHKSYFDKKWEAWNAEGIAINRKYDDVIRKALKLALEHQEPLEECLSVSEVLESLTAQPATPGLLLQAYLPLLNGDYTNDFMGLSSKKLERDQFSHTATFTTKNGHTITINNEDKLIGIIGLSAKKILDTATAYLTNTNTHKSTTPRPTVVIPLMEYWRVQGEHVDPLPQATEADQRAEQAHTAETIKKLKQGLRADLENLLRIEWRGKGKGQNRGDFSKHKFISSYHVNHNMLTVNFDVEIATSLVQQGYYMQWSPILLKHDNRDPNGYVIGRNILFHHSMDSNAIRGTENTLSVKSLLEAAPEIVTIEQLTAKGRRDWKKQIKEKLEQALYKNMTVAPLISRWEYRDPITGKTYTPETASELPWEAYFSLMVDYVMLEEPNQEPRRAARAAEKALLLPTPVQEPVKKKRGRPRKEKTESL